ncbi:MAG: hypothetical protein Q4F11_00225 [Eubacteriales bacterium]|nr:hypothetical protein [Eubacteriales bacterium]
MSNIILRKRYEDNADFRLFVQILLIFVLSRIFLAVMVPVYNGIVGTQHSFSFLMNEWDAKRYHFIIENGYTFPLDTDPQANWAFFPLYSLVCMVFRVLTMGFVDTYWIGMIVSNICIFIAAFYGVKLIKIMGIIKGDEGILLAVLMLAGPYTFYCSSAYTEAMFIMFIVLFFYFAKKRRFMAAGFMSACASGTRIVGCTLVFALLIEMYIDFARNNSRSLWAFIKHLLSLPQKITAIFLCPFGTFAYMLFLWFFCGDVWAFKNVQIAWREDTFFPVIGVLLKACTGQIEPRYTYMGWICIAVLVLYGYMIYRKFYSMAVFGIIALLIPLTSHVMSTCRFIIGTFVVFVGLYDCLAGRRKWVRNLAVSVMAVWEVILVFMWYNSDCWLM